MANDLINLPIIAMNVLFVCEWVEQCGQKKKQLIASIAFNNPKMYVYDFQIGLQVNQSKTICKYTIHVFARAFADIII